MIFVQARLSSNRFPGKVLAPVNGTPIIRRVLERCHRLVPQVNDVVLTTSTEPSDDPLACYAQHLGFAVFRGPLDNVLERLRQAAHVHGADWVVRVSGDSPAISPAVISKTLNGISADIDMVTNVFPRTFPKGQSVEIISRDLLDQAANNPVLTDDDKEHVTSWFYNNASEFRIRNIICPAGDRSDESHAVDVLDDLKHVEGLDSATIDKELGS